MLSKGDSRWLSWFPVCLSVRMSHVQTPITPTVQQSVVFYKHSDNVQTNLPLIVANIVIVKNDTLCVCVVCVSWLHFFVFFHWIEVETWKREKEWEWKEKFIDRFVRKKFSLVVHSLLSHSQRKKESLYGFSVFCFTFFSLLVLGSFVSFTTRNRDSHSITFPHSYVYLVFLVAFCKWHSLPLFLSLSFSFIGYCAKFTLAWTCRFLLTRQTTYTRIVVGV